VSHLSDALVDFSCGPGSHRASYGISIGQRLEGQTPICAVCFKALGPADCLFCNQAGEGMYHVAERGRDARGPLCELCHAGLLAGEGGEWGIA
jgi:hypothetical protein